MAYRTVRINLLNDEIEHFFPMDKREHICDAFPSTLFFYVIHLKLLECVSFSVGP